jgi:hypothetical protein
MQHARLAQELQLPFQRPIAKLHIILLLVLLEWCQLESIVFASRLTVSSNSDRRRIVLVKLVTQYERI